MNIFLRFKDAACSKATKSRHPADSLFAGLAHLGFKEQQVGMFEINPCRIDAKLTKSLDDAIANLDQLEKNHALCPIEAGDKLLAAQAAWVEHKMTCQFCCGQQLRVVH